MEDKKLEVAIVGLGKMGLVHAGILNVLPDFIKEISIHATIGPGGGYEDVSHWDQVVKGLEFLRSPKCEKCVHKLE